MAEKMSVQELAYDGVIHRCPALLHQRAAPKYRPPLSQHGSKVPGTYSASTGKYTRVVLRLARGWRIMGYAW